MGVVSQSIDLLESEQVVPRFGLMFLALGRSSWRCRTLVTENTAAFQVRSSGYGQVGFVALPGKALTRDALRNFLFGIYAAGWLNSMVIHNVLLLLLSKQLHRRSR